MSDKQKTCEERIGDELESTIDALRLLYSADQWGIDGDTWDEDEAALTTCDICGDEEDTNRINGGDICKTCLEKLEDLGTFNEYGLCFDYVTAGTFKDQEQGYFRYQLSYGGPSDEFRFYTDAERNCYCIEYWFMDWYDGAHRELTGDDKDLLQSIFSNFDDCGMVESEFEQAVQ